MSAPWSTVSMWIRKELRYVAQTLYLRALQAVIANREDWCPLLPSNGAPERIRTSGLRLRRAALYPTELRVRTVCALLTPRLREIFGRLKSEPDIRSSHCLVTSFYQHPKPPPDLTSAFGGQRSIQLSYGCVSRGIGEVIFGFNWDFRAAWKKRLGDLE